MSSRTRRAAWPLWDAQERQAKNGRRPRPIVCWRARAKRSSRLSVFVEVYPTRTALRRASAADGDVSRYSRRHTLAECVEIRCWRNKWHRNRVVGRRCRPEFAIIRLTTKSRTREIVHECFHATLRYARRIGERSLALQSGSLKGSDRQQVKGLEEHLAVVHENLVAAVVDGMFDFGFIKD